MDKIILAKSNRGAPDPIGLHNAEGTLINPATVEKLQELKVVLDSIFGAVDGLEIKADTINLNTDELEIKLQSIRDQIDVLLSTRASETTCNDIKNNTNITNTKIGEIQEIPSQYSLLGRLKDLWDKINGLFSDGLAQVKIWDGTNMVKVDSSNRLWVSSPPPEAPPETTSVIIVIKGNVAGGSYHTESWIIPTGKTVTIQRLSGGAQLDDKNGCVIELWCDTELCDAIYVSGSSEQHDFNLSYIGDGIKTIILKRRNLSGTVKEIFGKWEGYYS